MSTLPREMFQISRSVTGNEPERSYFSLEKARTMRDYAAQLGARMPKYLLYPEVAVLLSYFDNQHQRMYFDTLWNTGARPGEARAMRPVDFELEPSRHSPQPLAVVKTLKQRDRDARPQNRSHHIPIRATVNHRTPSPGLYRCSMPPMSGECGSTSQPGKSASGISLSGISVPGRQQLTGWIRH